MANSRGKAKFSLVVKEAIEKGFQTITKQEEPIAVILSKKEFDKITKPKTSFLDFFKAAPYQEIEFDTKRLKDSTRKLTYEFYLDTAFFQN